MVVAESTCYCQERDLSLRKNRQNFDALNRLRSAKIGELRAFAIRLPYLCTPHFVDSASWFIIVLLRLSVYRRVFRSSAESVKTHCFPSGENTGFHTFPR